jgi:hypothetical protein
VAKRTVGNTSSPQFYSQVSSQGSSSTSKSSISVGNKIEKVTTKSLVFLDDQPIIEEATAEIRSLSAWTLSMVTYILCF